MKHSITVGDIYSLYNDEINQWSLQQVIADITGQFVLLELLPFFSESPLEEELTELAPLLKNHHRWTDGYFYGWTTDRTVPEDLLFIANQAPLLTWEHVQDNKNNHKNDAWVPNIPQRIYQYYWEQLPKATTTAFKEKVFSKKNTSYVFTHAMVYANNAPETLQQVKDNPAIVELKAQGKIENLVALLEQQPILSKLEWLEHQQTVVDLRNTHLITLEIDVTGLQELHLNSRLKKVQLVGDYSQLTQLTLTHPRQGAFLEMSIFSTQELVVPDFKLPRLAYLSLKANQVDIQDLATFYPNLVYLKIWGNPGFLNNISALCQFKKLEYLFLNDLFGYQAADFPKKEQLPSLVSMWVISIPKAVGLYIKKEFKTLADLDINKLRNENWLAINLNNPFRSWDGRLGIQKADAKKAFTAYKKLHKALSKPVNKATCILLLKDFLEQFNAISNKKSDLATMEREEVTQVCLDLLHQIPLNDNELYAVLEGTIDF